MDIKTGDTVRFVNPTPDEEGLTMRVIELRGERILVEFLVGLDINPTGNVMVVDVEIAK